MPPFFAAVLGMPSVASPRRRIGTKHAWPDERLADENRQNAQGFRRSIAIEDARRFLGGSSSGRYTFSCENGMNSGGGQA